jgi:hypothetical protein
MVRRCQSGISGTFSTPSHDFQTAFISEFV